MSATRSLTIAPISFAFRSPYSFARTQGLPPEGRVAGGANLEIKLDANNQRVLAIAGCTLTPYHSNTPGPNKSVAAVYDQGSYGDSQNVIARFTGVGLPVDGAGVAINYVLPRPSNQRTQLLIQNNTIGLLYYAFDRIANALDCIAIAAGGTREFDSRIPQGGLSLYALANGAAVIEYMNNDVT